MEFRNKGDDFVDEKDKSHTQKAEDEPKDQVYLVETFYITSKKSNVFQVKLTSKGLCLRKETNGNTKEQLILLRDIVGCRCLRSKRKGHRSSCTCSSLQSPTHLKVVDENSGDVNETDISAYLYIYAYIIKKNKRNRTTLTLRFRSFDTYDDNNREAQKWRTAIKQLIRGDSPFSPMKITDPRKILILLNPKSGPGRARAIFQEKVAPIFVEAETMYELQVTKRANFAREFIRTKNIYLWKAIVVIGGDGIYWEVVNGIMEREDWEQALQTLPIGIIPCGSGNGLARSIAHKYNEPYEAKPIIGATIATVRGKIEEMDLVRIETRSQIMFSFLSCGWGLISDIDIESERLRSIGHQRFTLWSVHRLISLRTYVGKVSYLPIETGDIAATSIGHVSTRPTLKQSTSCSASLHCSECQGSDECDICDTGFGDVLSLETTSTNDHHRPRLDSWYSATSRRSAYFSTTESIYQSISERQSNNDLNASVNTVQMFGPASNIPALTSPISPNSGWVQEEGEYIMVHAAYQSHLGTECYFAPSATPNDGIIWLLIIRSGVSRAQLLSFLLGLSSGTHLPTEKSEHFQLLPVKAFRIEPTGAQGHITVDGESVEYGPVQGEIFPKMVKLMVPDYS